MIACPRACLVTCWSNCVLDSPPQVAALGFVSVFDQVLDGLPDAEQEAVFKAYVEALDEDPQQYRSDAQKWEAWVKDLSGDALAIHRRWCRESCHKTFSWMRAAVV